MHNQHSSITVGGVQYSLSCTPNNFKHRRILVKESNVAWPEIIAKALNAPPSSFMTPVYGRLNKFHAVCQAIVYDTYMRERRKKPGTQLSSSSSHWAHQSWHPMMHDCGYVFRPPWVRGGLDVVNRAVLSRTVLFTPLGARWP